MPKLRVNIPSERGWTKTPNYLLDRLMPVLRDTELRVLLVLLRETVGWNRPHRAVILRYRSLIARTGRQSEAISKAIASLEELGLIHRDRTFTHHPVRLSNRDHRKCEAQQYKDKK